jgi:hypothetical protein
MKIAICTPVHSDVAAEFAYSLTRLTAKTCTSQVQFNGEIVAPELEIFMRSSSVLPQLRNILVQDAMHWGADYLLWLDSDHQFPPDTLLRLLSLNLKVVGANYPRRVSPHLPTAIRFDGAPAWTSQVTAQNGLIEQVSSLGLGCCLVDMKVFDVLHEHASASNSQSIGPLFAVEMLNDGASIIGEDVFFFRRLAEAGVEVHLDHALSWNIGHVHKSTIWTCDVQSPDTA